MIVIRKVRGAASNIPDEEIKITCLHELLHQTVSNYASLNHNNYPHTTTDPISTLQFISEHYKILSDPFTIAQECIVQSIAALINNNDSLTIIRENKQLFTRILNRLHQNLNYNIILDCTVFKTPNNFLNPNPKVQITYFLIIQTKPITSDISLIRNFSKIERKSLIFEKLFYCFREKFFRKAFCHSLMTFMNSGSH